METLLWLCNWSTLGVCAALKLPQISAVLGARSSRGISLPSLLLELAGFLVFLRYQCYNEYPLLTYLEYPILITQGNRHHHPPPPSPCLASALSTSPPPLRAFPFQISSSCCVSSISTGM